MELKIKKAEYLESYRIQLSFFDGQVRIIDFQSFLEHSQNPTTRKYLKLDKFKEYRIEYGDLVWNDYELCFPIIDLYEDTITKEMPSLA